MKAGDLRRFHDNVNPRLRGRFFVILEIIIPLGRIETFYHDVKFLVDNRIETGPYEWVNGHSEFIDEAR